MKSFSREPVVDMADGFVSSRPEDLAAICHRVREKSESYEKYNFSSKFNEFLKAFFDLAQEFDTLEDFYRICVAVPLEMTDLDSALYLLKKEENVLWLACDSKQGVPAVSVPADAAICLQNSPYEAADRYIIPICSKQPPGVSPLPEDSKISKNGQVELWSGEDGFCGRGRLLGMFAVGPLSHLSPSDKFFFVKYVNRIGFNLDNRLIARQNIDHLKFINSLVMDIEHNVIVPNMYFLHLFNQLRKKIIELEIFEKELREKASERRDGSPEDDCPTRCGHIREGLLRYHQELVKHHANISLFLESLFRREHFEKGHLVLHPKRCFVEKEIILPQLEHYAARIRAAGITVERPENMLDEEFQIMVDIGLLAQVYANLFSNAAKYTREICSNNGSPRKAMAYGREIVYDFPEQGRQGIKFNVFTTGPPFSREEGTKLFMEGMRGRGCEHIPGTGHGLSFIRHVVELHGGTVGYETTPEGNNFYFILPLPTADQPSSS